MNTSLLSEDWAVLTSLLDENWRSKALELGALARKRKIQDADTLLRVLLIHLTSDKSLRTTAAYAKQVKLCDINDVALLHRLRAAKNWLHWMAVELLKSLQQHSSYSRFSDKNRVRLVDGSIIR